LDLAQTKWLEAVQLGALHHVSPTGCGQQSVTVQWGMLDQVNWGLMLHQVKYKADRTHKELCLKREKLGSKPHRQF
jgi:hypothetical protein